MTVRTYTLYVDDDRYSVPTLDAIGAADDRMAEAAGRARLAASPHYHAVELWDGDRLIARLTKDIREADGEARTVQPSEVSKVKPAGGRRGQGQRSGA